MVNVLRYYDETRQFTQVDASQLANLPTPIPSGSIMLFAQTTTPTGWTRLTTNDDALIRVVGSGTPGTGGTNGFVATVNSQTGTGTGSTGTGTTGTGTSGGHSLSIAELAAHTHNVGSTTQGATSACGTNSLAGSANTASSSTGSGTAHTHTIPGLSVPSLSVPSLSVTFNIKYVDVLYASKN